LILAAMIIARNPAQYGMDIEPGPVEAPKFEKVMVPVAVDLRRVAEWAGTSVQAIQELNPELRRWTTPVRSKDYELRVPDGAAELVRARLTESGADAAALSWHTVRKGETLLTISRKLKVNRADLADANYLSVKSRVTPGQQLVIPRAPTLLLATRTDNPAPLVETQKTAAVVTASAVVPNAKATASAAPVTAASKVIYRVKRGDTLASIARVFQTSVASLKKWNSLSGNVIQAGQRLTILTTARATATH
jgi:membrane-bound lytic murein transglycosylase D